LELKVAVLRRPIGYYKKDGKTRPITRKRKSRRTVVVNVSVEEPVKKATIGPEKLVVQEKTKHFGIPTTEKETVVTPAPSKLETESKTSLRGRAVPPSVEATQEDKRKLEFKTTDSENRKSAHIDQRKLKKPKAIDYV